MEIRVELDVDREARLVVVGGEILRLLFKEDMHYPSEPARLRDPTDAELVAIRERLDAGAFQERPFPVDANRWAWGS